MNDKNIIIGKPIFSEIMQKTIIRNNVGFIFNKHNFINYIDRTNFKIYSWSLTTEESNIFDNRKFYGKLLGNKLYTGINRNQYMGQPGFEFMEHHITNIHTAPQLQEYYEEFKMQIGDGVRAGLITREEGYTALIDMKKRFNVKD